mgnify:CR=1 FL=1
MKKVITGTLADYRVGDIREFLESSLQRISLIPPLHGNRVLLKPNLVMGKAPHKAVNTHPLVVQAVGELLLDRSCEVFIGDSPGYESTERALKSSGIMDVARTLGLRAVSFNTAVTKKSEGGVSPYRSFTFGEDPSRYDVIINLPKLKTHGMMELTLGVKNTFGFVHALEKARWHLRAGQDRMLFASILIDIHRLVNPTLTILDGIVGMDRDGPSNGRARPVGVMALSSDAFALDHAMEKILRLRAPTPITRKALEHDLVGRYDLEGVDALSIRDFEIPDLVDTDWALPNLVKRALRKVFVKKPRLNRALCKGCGICRQVCPAGALTFLEERPSFDYRKCIRCYCCQEMCPEGAITL